MQKVDTFQAAQLNSPSSRVTDANDIPQPAEVEQQPVLEEDRPVLKEDRPVSKGDQ
jgi:hypothetical protein